MNLNPNQRIHDVVTAINQKQYHIPSIQRGYEWSKQRVLNVMAGRLTTVLPGAYEALAAVRAAGDRVVIITAKHPISVEPSLRAVGISADETFTLVHGPEKAAVLRRLNAAVYVGDTPPDMAAAVQAGARAVGVTTGSFTGQDLAAAGAEIVLDALTGFPDWYRSVFPARPS